MFKKLHRKYPHPVFQYVIAAWILSIFFWEYYKDSNVIWLIASISFWTLLVGFFCYLEGGNDEYRRSNAQTINNMNSNDIDVLFRDPKVRKKCQDCIKAIENTGRKPESLWFDCPLDHFETQKESICAD